MARYTWSVPKLHPGSTILCVGSGPSLKDYDFDRLRGRGPIIAVNSMGLLLPFADYIFFGDSRWWRWHKDKVAHSGGPRLITTGAATTFRESPVLQLQKDYQAVLSRDPTSLSGLDSGRQAINLAYHLGAARIVLLGYDMGWTPGEDSHAHTAFPHETDSVLKNYTDKFAPPYEFVVEELRREGIEIATVTPSPRLPFIQLHDLDAVAPRL